MSRSSARRTPPSPTSSSTPAARRTGGEAQAFAKVIRKHTLEATGGKTYAQMPQYITADGKGTSDKAAAGKDPKTGAPNSNPARQIWVTETALNTAYFAESMATFVIAIGFALLLTGNRLPGPLAAGAPPARLRDAEASSAPDGLGCPGPALS